MITRSTEKIASESIEATGSEINRTDALSDIPRVGLRELGRSIRDLPRLRADDEQLGSDFTTAGLSANETS
jgi:hypothetical protein